MKKIYLSLPIVACSLFANAQENQSDTTSISEVMITENRFQVPFSKRNRDIQIITKEEIAVLPVKSIHEVLTFLAGVDLRQRGPFGGQADVSMDGGSFEQVLILLNGAKISDPQTGHHSLNIPIALDAIERIEVLKGPLSRIYGINALTGAINIVTKAADKSSLSIHTQVGSSFKEKETGDGTGEYAGGDVQVVSNIVSGAMKNLIALSGNTYNGQRYNSKGQNLKGYLQGEYQVNPSNSIEWFGGYIDNEFGANAYYAAPGDRESYELVKTAFASVSSKHQLTENFFLSPRITNRFNKDDYRYYRNDLSKARSRHESNVLSFELNSRLQTCIGDFGLGMELRDEDLTSTNMGNHLRENFGSYLEYRTELIPKVMLNTGAYVNYNTQYGWEVYPGLDIGYAFVPNWKVMVNVGKSQRIPSFTDLFLKQPSNVGNPNLTSEHAWQYEASIQGKIASLNIQARYFHREISDFIDWTRETTTQPYRPYNLGNNEMQGLSIGLQQLVTISNGSKLGYDLSYSHLIPKERTYTTGVISKYAVESLKNQAIARVWLRSSQWNVSVANKWIKRALNDPYFLTDCRVGFQVSKLLLYADVNNVWDATYQEFGAVPLSTRWYSLGVKWDIL